MSDRQMIIGGNWKMYKTPSEAVTTAKALKVKLINIEKVEVVICPPFTDLVPVYEIIKETRIKLGGQNLYWEDEGAFTGEISAAMLKDAGCEYVIIGHSERRHIFNETDEQINKKIKQALKFNLKPIFCVGETLEQRNNGLTNKVVEEQIRQGLSGINIPSPDQLVIAYEPVWAIGTGVNATPQQAEEVQNFIRELLQDLISKDFAEKIRIQYGGSVKPANAEALLKEPDIDGALVGGASLDAESFTQIIKIADKLPK